MDSRGRRFLALCYYFSEREQQDTQLGVRVVISKGWNHANLAVLSLIAHGWGVRNAQDHSPTQTWTRVLPVQRPYISRSHANNQNNTRNARAPHSEGTSNNEAHHRAHLRENVSEPPKIMHSSPGHHERSHQTCTVAHNKEQPDSALWPGHCIAKQCAALPNDDRPGPNTNQRPRSPAASGRSRTGVR